VAGRAGRVSQLVGNRGLTVFGLIGLNRQACHVLNRASGQRLCEIISIDGESYRKREAEQAQKRKQEQKPKR
jgi:hypothetical protein